MNELRELVEQWRRMASKEGALGNINDQVTYEMCAAELEAALDDLEERNVSDDLAMDPEHFAALVAESRDDERQEKRTNARVHGLDYGGQE
jgi:hypothetical protein